MWTDTIVALVAVAVVVIVFYALPDDEGPDDEAPATDEAKQPAPALKQDVPQGAPEASKPDTPEAPTGDAPSSPPT